MNFTFYDELVSQPDVQDITSNLHKSVNILKALQNKLHQLPPKDINTASFAEVSARVENLINKHFPNLVHDYCKLSLEYRNTVVIKKEQSNGKTKEYTAKDILLNNLSKFIEEIHVLDYEFNDNYSHKLLVQKRFVDQLGVQKNIIQVKSQTFQTEVEEELSAPSVENFNYVKSILLKEENKPIVDSVDDSQTIGIGFGLLEITILLTFIAIFVTAFYMMYAKTAAAHNANTEIMELNRLQSNIRSLYANTGNYLELNMDNLKESKVIPAEKFVNNNYENSFDGKIEVKPYTSKSANDSFVIETTNIPQEACMKISVMWGAMQHQLIINDTVVKESMDTKEDMSKIVSSCHKDNNKITVVTN